MQKRRERIERWRAERKKKELEATKKDGKTSILANLQLPMKKWSLEDDSDEVVMTFRYFENRNFFDRFQTGVNRVMDASRIRIAPCNARDCYCLK